MYKGSVSKSRQPDSPFSDTEGIILSASYPPGALPWRTSVGAALIFTHRRGGPQATPEGL